MTYIKFLEPLEKKLIKKYGDSFPPIITISGLSGSGKGTHAALLQMNIRKHLGLIMEIHESGQFFREVARDMGYNEARLGDFSKKVASSETLAKKIDHEIERKTLEKMFDGGGIFVGRLTFATIGDMGYKIMLKVDPQIVAQRIVADPTRDEYEQSVGEARAQIIKRDTNDVKRYEKLYKINYEELSQKCDLIIENTGTIQETEKKIFDEASLWLLKSKL